MLVTRLPDRAALARLVRAALRHEVAQVALSEGPRKVQPHTLDLRVAERSALSLLAEPVGAPQNGHFPLRLRPVNRAQAAELYALLEAENGSDGSPAPAVESAKPDSPAPATLAYGSPVSLEPDSAPIARQMSGSAPPPIAPLHTPTDPMRSGPTRTDPLQTKTDPMRTGWKPASDDPRRTSPSASWSEADANDPSLSVSVVFEPDMMRAPADDEAPSISVSVVFEPDVSPATEVSREPPPSSAAPATIAEEPFFDDALANLPAFTLDETDDAFASSEAPVLSADIEGPLSDDDDDDFETLIRAPSPSSSGQVPAAVLPAAGRPMVPPPTSTAEDFTPTAQELPAGGRGRKKKTTRRGKGPEKRSRHRIDEGQDVDADAETQGRVGFPVDEPGSSRRGSKSDHDPIEGRRIADGKYVIDALIGSGAAGAVYKATHRELRRTVAIKVLHPHYQEDPHFMKSFRGEALAASQLDHPNVMRVLDFGQEPDGLVYIVMEFLSGRTLQSLLDEERRLPPDRAVEIMIQVCAALSVAHDHGIIHRDIKPDNIMLVPSRNDEGGTFELVKVCDFGIAALQNPRAEDSDFGVAEAVIAGTPEYMSPEQARGIEIDARSDVYAAGICLYELVTGRPPFLGDHAGEILIKQLEEPPKPPSQLSKGLDPLLEEVILRAIQKDPAKRPQSARELRVELKELIDPGDHGAADDDDERSIVENVPVLDDPASGFAGFFIGFSSALLRFGRFERGHPEAAQAMKELLRSTKTALRGRGELTFARRDSPQQKQIGFCVMSGTAEIVDLKRLLGSQLYGSFGQPFIEYVVKKGIAAMTLREGVPDTELQYVIEMLIGPHAHEELRKELFTKPLRYVSILFVSDVLGRDRKLSWKVGLCAARLARDLTALSNVRGISLKKMREVREDLVGGVARLLTRGDEVKQFLQNVDLVEEAVANLRGFSSFQLAPLALERILHEPCAEAAMLLVADFDGGDDSPALKAQLRMFSTRLLAERSPKSDAAVTELYKRSIVTDADVPRDLRETIRAGALADALVREPSQFLRTLDMIGEPDAYGRELATLEAAMSVLARRAEAGALLAVISTLARHAKTAGKPGEREAHALRTMKSMIDRQRLVPIANALLVGPAHQREAARQLLVLAGSAGVSALYIAREGLTDASARPIFVKVFKDTGPAGWSLLTAVLPRLEVRDDADLALVEDLIRAMPERPDPVLGEAVAKFLAHPRLRPAALAAIVPLWGERARKPLLDALEFAEEPARIVAVTELRRMRAIDEQVVNVIERLLTMRGSASEELRAAVAAALADVSPPLRTRAIALLAKGVEGKRGFVAILRGDGGTDESLVVIEAMARALLVLDRNEGVRALKARIQRSEGVTRARLSAVLQMA